MLAKFLKDCKKMCVENTGGEQVFQIGKNAYISLSCYKNGGYKELSISNGQSNPTRVVYRNSNFLDNTSYLKIDYELSIKMGRVDEDEKIKHYVNYVIIESDFNLTFDCILKKACEEFKFTTFINIYKPVLLAFKRMQQYYPDICFQKEV